MESLFFWCSVVGGTILVAQTVLLILGIGDVDADAGADFSDVDPGDFGHGNVFAKALTFQTFVAFLTFFGLAGMACRRGELNSTLSLIIAIASGLTAFALVGYLMALLTALQGKGNVELQNAVGSTARVYLRIPAQKKGAGKVTVAVQGRSIECRAVTVGSEIATGEEVQIIGVRGPRTVEVVATEKGESIHASA